MSFFETVLDYGKPDNYSFHEESAKKRLEIFFEKRYQKLLEADHPSSFHEERGKLCGYAFERGDLVYRCK